MIGQHLRRDCIDKRGDDVRDFGQGDDIQVQGTQLAEIVEEKTQDTGLIEEQGAAPTASLLATHSRLRKKLQSKRGNLDPSFQDAAAAADLVDI